MYPALPLQAKEYDKAYEAWSTTGAGAAFSLKAAGEDAAGATQQLFSSYYGSSDYAATFITASIKGTAPYDTLGALSKAASGADESDKARSELATKGIALQSLLMASLSSSAAAVQACVAKDKAAASAAVDKSWALFATDNGPIALSEKRCPQFNTCALSPSASAAERPAGISSVNVRLLAAYKSMQTAAAAGDCAGLAATQRLTEGLMVVPVIQGMLREAWEVDPSEGKLDATGKRINVGGKHVSDGFVEVCEGWAFTRAVLPMLNRCDAAVAKTIALNMDTIANGKHVAFGGFIKVVRETEKVLKCLGVTCDDVKSMVDKVTKKPHWQACPKAAEKTCPTCPTCPAAAKAAEEDEGGETLQVVLLFLVIALIIGSHLMAPKPEEPKPVNEELKGLA